MDRQRRRNGEYPAKPLDKLCFFVFCVDVGIQCGHHEVVEKAPDGAASDDQHGSPQSVGTAQQGCKTLIFLLSATTASFVFMSVMTVGISFHFPRLPARPDGIDKHQKCAERSGQGVPFADLRFFRMHGYHRFAG